MDNYKSVTKLFNPEAQFLIILGIYSDPHLNSGQSVGNSNGGLKSKPFYDRTDPHNLNTKLVCYSDPHCNIVSTLGVVSTNGGASSQTEATTPKAMAKQEVSLKYHST